MRGRRGRLVGGLLVGAYAALLIAAAVAEIRRDDLPRVATVPTTGAVAEELAAAWERSRTGTFVVSGTYERSSPVTGASLASEDVLAQRPPDRLHRQLGGIEGRRDDRLLLCPAPPTGDDDVEPCRLGEAGGRTYAEDVALEVAGIRSLTTGPDPLYAVRAGRDDGCFDLDLRRPDPRAPFGIEASFCFDPATGAPASSRVEHPGGVVEVTVATSIRTDVTDADLEP